MSPASVREMEGCLCPKCLNPHAIFNTVKKLVPDLPLSLSQYFTKHFKCAIDTNINCVKIDCIKGVCLNSCTIVNDVDQIADQNRLCSYYVFEKKTETYFDSHGNEKQFERTARVDKVNTLGNVYNLLICAKPDFI